jgi:hypothetical protein
VVDLGPKRAFIAKLFRQMSGLDNVRRKAFATIERTMKEEGISWSDIGNAIEHGDGNYTEEEMLELAQTARAEGVDAGIKIGAARANSNGSGNGCLILPPPVEMAEFCQTHCGRLRDDEQRTFIDEMVVRTRHQLLVRNRLTSRTLGYLASLYIGIGGKTT